MAEELGAEALGCELATVHGLEPIDGPAAPPVEGGRDQLLAGPGLAEDQDRRVDRREG